MRRWIAGWLGPKILLRLRAYLTGKSAQERGAIGRRLGALYFRVAGRRRRTALSNLAIAFPEMPRVERARIARESFQNVAIEACDFLVASGRTMEQLNRETTIEGIEAVDQALQQGKGALLITAHFGNWERCAQWLAAHGYPLAVVARDANQGETNDLVNDVRREFGTRVIGRTRAGVGIMRTLKKGGLVALVPDQNAEGEYWIELFGHTAGTVSGPGLVHRKTGCPIIGMTCVRVGPERFRLRFEAIQDLPEDGDKTGDGVMLGINRWLEEVITDDPEQWLWMHDRWRSAREMGKF